MTSPATARGPRGSRALAGILRCVGAVSLLALIFVAAPHAWMDSIHRWAGMGPLPDEPVVGYLARSTSAFYAMTGGLMILVSTDLRRYRGIVEYLGFANALFGAALVAIDWGEGLPFMWALGEGPVVCALGIVLLVLSRR